MRNRIAFYAMALGVLGTACKGSGDPTGNPPPGSQSPPAVASLSLNQTTASLTVPQSVQLTATARDVSGNVLSGRTVTWSTIAGSIASVSSNGLVTAVGPGTAKITATSEGKSAEATITVPQPAVSSVELTIPSTTLEVGQTTTVVAVAKSSTGAVITGRSFTWTTSQASVATVSVGGVVTALMPGETTISATTDGKSASGTITVVAVPVASVELSQTAASIVVGTTTTLTATPRSASNSALTGRIVTWTTANPSIATVADGIVTGVAPGVTTVTATSEGKSADATITVTPVPVATVVVTPGSVPLTVGTNAQLTATARDAGGNALTDRVFTWSTTAPSVATVADGVVTAVAPGTATITATAEGKEGTASITVSAPPEIADGKRTVSIGQSQTCSIDSGAKVWCWGRGTLGNLGNGTTPEEQITPVPISNSSTFVGLSSGFDHVCGVASDGKGWCWGWGSLGALGNGSTDNQSTPVEISGGFTWNQIAVSSGARLSCGLRSNNLAYCWGSNGGGGLGIGSAVNAVATPQPVSGLRQFLQIATSNGGACALTAEGAAWCWGSGGSGQLGRGSTESSGVPVAVSGEHSFVEIAAGHAHYCALKASGEMWCWGFNSLGQVGDGTTTNRNVPTKVLGGHTFVSLTNGSVTTCGLKADGSVWCWGTGNSGQLGNGTNANSQLAPGIVSGGLEFLQISGGSNAICGVATTGLYCWGSNNYGMLGDGTKVARNVPTKVVGLP